MDQKENRKSKKSKFNLGKILINILLSPIVIVLLGYLYFQDFRKAILLALILITAWNLIELLMQIFKLGIATLTFNIFGFFKTSINIVISIFVITLYWFLYILAFGSNYSF